MLVSRLENNPIFKPIKNHLWESRAVFNGCPVEGERNLFFLYRAISEKFISSIGIAESKNGFNFYNRRRIIIPEKSWEIFGCEDPRITKLSNKYYIFYTALSNNLSKLKSKDIKVGLAISKNLRTIQEKHLITFFNAKGMALFPEKINGKIWSVLTINTDQPPAKICLASFKKEREIWSKKYWQKWYKDIDKNCLNLRRTPKDQIEVGAPPIKTKFGWLLIYCYIRDYFSSNPVFGVEVALLALENPNKIIGRTKESILNPEKHYEKNGLVPNIVFPSGALLKKEKLHLYYGAADTTCCMAVINLKSLLNKILR